MKKIAITGNIAAGKSTVENILKNLGYKVFDTDCMAHQILDESKNEIIKLFSGFDVIQDEELSREKLAKIVFSDNKLLKKLEKFIHPKIKDKIELVFAQNTAEELVFVAIPLLFEAGMENLFDKSIMVYCEDAERLRRLRNRNGYSEEIALKRMNSQMPQEVKKLKVDYVLDNSQIDFDLIKDVKKLVEKIKA